MPKIIILNVGTEHALGDRWSSTHPITRSGWRHAWFADAGDVIISPGDIDADFREYMGETLGFEADSITVLADNRLVTDELLLSDYVVKNLTRLVDSTAGWTIMPCFVTPGVEELANVLGISSGMDLGFATQCGADLLNRKTHFRQLAAGIDLPIPSGAVTRSSCAVASAIERYLPRTGTVIVKQDDGAGGMGNLTLTTDPVEPLPGSRETRPVNGDVDDLAETVWSELSDETSHGLVVESYHAASVLFYLEYVIGDDAIPRLLNTGTVRNRPDTDPDAAELVWVGLDIPAELPPWLNAKASGHGMRMAMLLARIGYRGYFNIDGLATDEGELVFNEINARWGGGLVGHSICERLLGQSYADRHVFSTVRDIPPTSLAEVRRKLHASGLAFTQAASEGAVVLSCDPMLINSTECLVIGDSRRRVREIEETLRQTVDHG